MKSSQLRVIATDMRPDGAHVISCLRGSNVLYSFWSNSAMTSLKYLGAWQTLVCFSGRLDQDTNKMPEKAAERAEILEASYFLPSGSLVTESSALKPSQRSRDMFIPSQFSTFFQHVFPTRDSTCWHNQPAQAAQVLRREALDLGQALRQWVAEAEAEAEDAQKEAPEKPGQKRAVKMGRFWGSRDRDLWHQLGTQLILPCHQAPMSSVAQSVAISEAGFLKTDPLGSPQTFFWGQKGCQWNILGSLKFALIVKWNQWTITMTPRWISRQWMRLGASEAIRSFQSLNHGRLRKVWSIKIWW